jgi:hypothetical protein
VGVSELAGNVGISGDLLVANGGDVKLDGGGNMLLEDGGNLTLDSGDLTMETGDIVIESGTLRTEAGHGANIQVNDVNDGETHKIGLSVKNTDNNAAAGALKVEGYAEIIGNAAGNPATTALKTKNESTHADARALKVEGKADITDFLHLGTANNDGLIDAADDARNLKIGTQADFTADVEIGRDGRSTLVRSDLLKVGQAGEVGKIESGGTTVAPQDLKIGTNGETNDIRIGRAGVTVDVQCQERLNSKALIMNGAASLLDVNGCGQVFNAGGHPGPNMPCMDYYINGAVVGYIDANGWNNA